MRKPLDRTDHAKGVAARIGPAASAKASAPKLTMRAGALYHADGAPVRAGDLKAGHDSVITKPPAE